jgi:pimeloyl-ACP methyl ester carboxylesterase
MQIVAALLVLLLTACAAVAPATKRPIAGSWIAGEIIDPARGRAIPVQLYGRTGSTTPLAILLPGYGLSHTEYSFIARALVRRGHLVAAIQPQRADDPPVPSGENVAIKRRPFWQRGVDDVRFVARKLTSERLAKTGPVLVVGHSHGGDIAMLYATTHPRELAAVFTLDNRRMPMPRTRQPRICSARSSDMPADPGVIPDVAVQSRMGMLIVPLTAMRHDDMFDGASPAQQKDMLTALDGCLR